MTATNELRKMLDDRGVEWKATAKNRTVINGDWIADEDVEATKYGDDTVFCAWTLTYHLTAEQVIDAVLGRGECELEEGGWSTEGDHARVWLTCGHDCMVDTVADLPKFCPKCGRQVKR